MNAALLKLNLRLFNNISFLTHPEQPLPTGYDSGSLNHSWRCWGIAWGCIVSFEVPDLAFSKGSVCVLESSN